MNRFALRLTLPAAVVVAGACLVFADAHDVNDPAAKKPTATKPATNDKAAQKPGKFQPPQMRLQAAAKVTYGDAKFTSLTFEVSNPNRRPLAYFGYLPDSFGPPLKKGQMAPLYKIELKLKGKWKPHPLGFCGTGLGKPTIPPADSASFSVAVPADDWEAVRIGLSWYPPDSKIDDARQLPIAWSKKLTRKAIEQREKQHRKLKKPANPAPGN